MVIFYYVLRSTVGAVHKSKYLLPYLTSRGVLQIIGDPSDPRVTCFVSLNYSALCCDCVPNLVIIDAVHKVLRSKVSHCGVRHCGHEIAVTRHGC